MVRINRSCINCGLCIPICPVNAIRTQRDEETAFVDQEECVECGTCYRSQICPVDAIVYPKLAYPRILRRHFSDPTSRHEVTGVPGRGTEEIKTNDVTNRLTKGKVGFCVEVGRPGIGTSIKEVEKITRALSMFQIRFEEKNPIRHLMSKPETGEFKKEVLNEKVLSIIIEFTVPEEKTAKILKTLKKIGEEIDTVFSLGLASRILDNGKIPIQNTLNKLDISFRANAKVNLGMGKLS
jgi:NAD-dependent dihydropyrimidine dehydrogenase PreA subunit